MKETRFIETEIGIIPGDWDICLVGDAFKRLKSNTLSRDCLNYKDGTIKNIHYGDILTIFGEYIDINKAEVPYINPEISITVSSTNKLQDNDVIFADTAEDEVVGKATQLVNVNHSTVVSGLHTIVLRPYNKTFAPKYLGYFFNSSTYHNQLFPYMQGIKVLSVSKKAIESTYLIYPKDVLEQKRIAEALSEIDSLISQIGNLIEKKKAIKQGAIQNLIAGKTRLKGYTKPWIKTNLGEIGEAIRGVGFSPSQTSQAYSVNYIPLLRSNNIDNNNIDFNDLIYVLKDCIASNQYMHDGDILICAANGSRKLVGKSGVFHKYGDYTFGAFMCVFRCFDNSTSDYIGYLLQSSQYKKQLEDVLTGSAINNLNSSQIESLIFSIPSDINEQKAIAKVLRNMDKEIELLISKHSKYIAIKQGMMQQLLSGKIRLK